MKWATKLWRWCLGRLSARKSPAPIMECWASIGDSSVWSLACWSRRLTEVERQALKESGRQMTLPGDKDIKVSFGNPNIAWTPEEAARVWEGSLVTPSSLRGIYTSENSTAQLTMPPASPVAQATEPTSQMEQGWIPIEAHIPKPLPGESMSSCLDRLKREAIKKHFDDLEKADTDRWRERHASSPPPAPCPSEPVYGLMALEKQWLKIAEAQFGTANSTFSSPKPKAATKRRSGSGGKPSKSGGS